MPEETTIIRRTVEHGFRSASGGAGDIGASKALAVAAIREQRDNEKAELSRLNDRFAAYIQRVKFLESQNKQLQSDLEELRARWGIDAERIKREFEPALQDARNKLDAITGDKAQAEIRAKRAEYDSHTYKQLYDDVVSWVNGDRMKMEMLESTLRENESELEVLRSQITDTENEISRQRQELDRLYEELQRLLQELDEETLQRIQLENEKQTLEEQIPFINAVHEQEIAELKALASGAHIDPTAFYRGELQRAIKEIRTDFESLSNAQRKELEEYYRIKTDEIRRQEAERQRTVPVTSTSESDVMVLRNSVSESRRELSELQQECGHLTTVLSQLEADLEEVRRSNMGKSDDKDREIMELRSKLNELMANYDEIVANKTSLEFEINTYRRLLEGEEAHVRKISSERPAAYQTRKYEYMSSSSRAGLREQTDSTDVTTNANASPRVTQTEMQAKTTYQRSAKGPVSIAECSPDGKVIILENTSKNKDIDLSGWKLYRRVDNNPEISFFFPAGYRLNSSRNVRVWARGHGRERSPSDLVNNSIESWGMGVNVVTRLINEQGDEKATHIQRTVYAS